MRGPGVSSHGPALCPAPPRVGQPPDWDCSPVRPCVRRRQTWTRGRGWARRVLRASPPASHTPAGPGFLAAPLKTPGDGFPLKQLLPEAHLGPWGLSRRATEWWATHGAGVSPTRDWGARMPLPGVASLPSPTPGCLPPPPPHVSARVSLCLARPHLRDSQGSPLPQTLPRSPPHWPTPALSLRFPGWDSPGACESLTRKSL